MNILFIFYGKMNPEHGGVERVSTLLAGELKHRGHNPAFLSVSDIDDEDDSIDERGIPQYVIPRNSPDFKQRFEKLLETSHTDIVILQGLYGSVVSVLDHIPENVKNVVVLHNKPHAMHGYERKIHQLTSPTGLPIKTKLMRLLAIGIPSLFRMLNDSKNSKRIRTIVDKTDKFVVLSEGFIPYLSAITPGLDMTKITAINNPNTFTPGKGLPEGKKNIVLVVARLSNPQKNVTGFIDVWKQFSQKHPDWEAKIVGDGEDSQWIKRYAQEKGVERLSFEGSRKRVDKYYQEAKLLCMTSTYEGWGMVLTEAMAYGCVPVVFDSYAAVRDIIDDGKNGLLATPFDTADMANKLSIIADDDDLRDRMAEAGKIKIKEFEIGKITVKWEKLLSDL